MITPRHAAGIVRLRQTESPSPAFFPLSLGPVMRARMTTRRHICIMHSLGARRVARVLHIVNIRFGFRTLQNCARKTLNYINSGALLHGSGYC